MYLLAVIEYFQAHQMKNRPKYLVTVRIADHSKFQNPINLLQINYSSQISNTNLTEMADLPDPTTINFFFKSAKLEKDKFGLT